MSANKDIARIAAVRDLVELRGPLNQSLSKLREYPWDFNGEPFILRREHIENALEVFLHGVVNASFLEKWASAIELREDVAYADQDRDWISDSLFLLSDEAINGPITEEVVAQMLSKLV